MNVNLSGKLSLICASSKGLGYACAKQLAIAGSDVILTSRSKTNLDNASAEIRKALAETESSAKVFVAEIDFEDKKCVDEFIDNIGQFGEIDVLITNSGGPAPGAFSDFSSSQELEEKCASITYPATSLMMQAIPQMKKKGWGRIINISSIGLARPITGLAVSNAARAHLGGLMTGISNETAKFGITVNSILPGIIWTERQLELSKSEALKTCTDLESVIKQKRNSIPLGDMGKPDDVAYLATFLASDFASYISGQFIAVDGSFLGLLR